MSNHFSSVVTLQQSQHYNSLSARLEIIITTYENDLCNIPKISLQHGRQKTKKPTNNKGDRVRVRRRKEGIGPKTRRNFSHRRILQIRMMMRRRRRRKRMAQIHRRGGGGGRGWLRSIEGMTYLVGASAIALVSSGWTGGDSMSTE